MRKGTLSSGGPQRITLGIEGWWGESGDEDMPWFTPSFSGQPADTPLRALVVGAGFSGARFIKVIQYLQLSQPGWIEIAGLCDLSLTKAARVSAGVPTYANVADALRRCRPDLVVVAVNEFAHAEILHAVADSEVGLVLCEKPLAATLEDAYSIQAALASKSLCLNLLERFSTVITALKRWMDQQQSALRPVRVEFFWGKNRIGDLRPSMGVLSEVIHPIDLVNYLFTLSDFELYEIGGLRSNYSPVSAHQLDTIDFVAEAGGYPLVGHSSFAWPRRMRTVSALLTDSESRLYRVVLDFDIPEWDCDTLSIAEIDSRTGKVTPLRALRTTNASFPRQLHGLFKVCRFVQAGLHVHYGLPEMTDVVDTTQAVQLQRWLRVLEVGLTDRRVPIVDVIEP